MTVHRIAFRRAYGLSVLRRVLPRTTKRLRLAHTATHAIRELGLRPDIVEAPEWQAEGLWLKRATSAPVIVHLHSPMYTLLRRRGRSLSLDERLAARLERVAARRAVVVTAGASAANEVAPGRHWIEPARVEITPMPGDRRLFDAPAGSWPRERILVACGRLDWLKAPELLVDAAAVLAGEFPDLRVVLVGNADRRDAPMYDDYGLWVAERARQRGVSLELTGRLPWDQVVEHYRRARVVVVPSRYESFSMVALEAMSCGTPVVVTSACGIAEHLSPLGRGWVVPVDDAGALAESLRPLLEDSDQAERCGSDARAFAREHFGPGTAAQARLALYERLLQRDS